MGNKKYSLFVISGALIAFLLVNLLVVNSNYRWDLTSTNKYTIDAENKAIIESQKDRMVITLLMGDEVPTSFKKLKSEATFLLSTINSLNQNIKYDIFDPTRGNADQRKAMSQIFAQKNVLPTNIRVTTKDGISETLVYPYVHIESSQGEQFVNILESRLANENEEEAIHRSILSLEGKISKAIFELSKEKQNRVGLIAFSNLLPRSTFNLVSNLKSHFNTEILTTNDLLVKKDSISVAIIPVDPNYKVSKQDLLLIDQYQMHGGKIVWLVEEYAMGLDSIGKYGNYIPYYSESSLNDYLFSHGLKVSGTWVQDLRCSRIPQVVGQQGGKAQTELLNYGFHTVTQGNPEHFITAQTGEVSMYYPTVINLLSATDKVNVTPLLASSEYSKKINYPYEFSFEEVRSEYSVETFIDQHELIAVLLEGRLQSYFKSRITNNQIENLKNLDIDFKSESIEETAMIVVTDQDFAISGSDRQGRAYPIGFNKWERRVFEDNEEFLVNSMEYMLNGSQFLKIKATDEIVYASLDKRKIAEESTYFLGFNLLAPLILLISLYFGIVFYLKAKYG